MNKFTRFLVCIVLMFLFSQILWASAEVRVQYACGEPAATTTEIKPILNLINTGDSAIDLREIEMRYYYTKEGSVSENFYVDYAAIGSSNVIVSFAIGYVSIKFASGELPSGAQTGKIMLRFFKEDWSSYDQLDDYSFNPSNTTLLDWDRITVLYNEQTIYGYQSPTPLHELVIEIIGDEGIIKNKLISVNPLPDSQAGLFYKPNTEVNIYTTIQPIPSPGMDDYSVAMFQYFEGDFAGTGERENITVTMDTPQKVITAVYKVFNLGLTPAPPQPTPEELFELIIKTTGDDGFIKDRGVHLSPDPVSATGGCYYYNPNEEVILSTYLLNPVPTMRAISYTYAKFSHFEGEFTDRGDGSYSVILDNPREEITAVYTIETIWGLTPPPTPAPNIEFYLPSVTVAPGDKFEQELTLNINGTGLLGNFAGYGIEIHYDPAILKVDESVGDGVDAGPDGFFSSVNYGEPGKLKIAGFLIGGIPPQRDIHFLTIHWVALADGVSYTTIWVNELFDTKYNMLNGGQVNTGRITVASSILLGDVNKDDKITIVDALIVAQYSVGLDVPIFFKPAADVNKDDIINIVDALIIAQHYVGIKPIA